MLKSGRRHVRRFELLSPLTLDDLVLDEPDKPERRSIRSKAWVDQETQLSLKEVESLV
uniref:Ovule protein n=1 Tax=Parascaris univalens TaxID=6257 RepID=A0A914ZXR9_PARUN